MGKTTATAYGNGGGPVSTISSGVFTGRTVGGGTRTDVFGNRFVPPFYFHPVISFFANFMKCFVFGNRKYGSGYPGYPIGVVGYGFPFFFWPLAFGGSYVYGAHYIGDSNEVSVLLISYISWMLMMVH